MENFENIIEAGKTPNMLKKYEPLVGHKFDEYLNPQTLKEKVLKSERVQKLMGIYAESRKCKIKDVEQSVVSILNEIGLERNLSIIRMCGMAITRIGQRICESINVNYANIERVKQHLGDHPVLYLPSHRSYMDFILMSYICFHYGIEIPGIAAGMDFHGMFGIGTMLRKTGAFFMRRSFSNDELYWDIFREYIYALVAHYHIGVEFFIEGTRSRNFKALQPKIGLLSMALLPYFTGEVTDVIIVPVSISYERILEEELFVYELLGVPKPKESTTGFLKAFKILEQKFGSMYIDFGQPISVHKFFTKASPALHSLEMQRRTTIPTHLQNLNKSDLQLIKLLANEVVFQQQRGIVLNAYNLICLYYATELYRGCVENLTLEQAVTAVCELHAMLKNLGAQVTDFSEKHKQVLKNAITIHGNIMVLQGNNITLKKIAKKQLEQQIDKRKLKGYAFDSRTMSMAVPIISLQIYINPLLFWLARPAFLLLAGMRLKHDKRKFQDFPQLVEQLRENAKNLENIFKYEFILDANSQEMDFERHLAFLQNEQAFSIHKSSFECELQINLHKMCIKAILSGLAPFILLYYNLCVTLNEMQSGNNFTAKMVLMKLQLRLEKHMLNTRQYHEWAKTIHPYCLALDNLQIALNFFTQAGYLLRDKTAGMELKLNPVQSLQPILNELKLYATLLPFQQYMKHDMNDTFITSKL